MAAHLRVATVTMAGPLRSTTTRKPSAGAGSRQRAAGSHASDQAALL